MLASQIISVVLPGSVPFGFKMQGGREYRAPLTILSVSQHHFVALRSMHFFIGGFIVKLFE